MKLGPVTELDKSNRSVSKKIDDDFISVSCNIIVIFLIYGHFGTTLKPDSDAWSVIVTFSSRSSFTFQ